MITGVSHIHAYIVSLATLIIMICDGDYDDYNDYDDYFPHAPGNRIPYSYQQPFLVRLAHVVIIK